MQAAEGLYKQIGKHQVCTLMLYHVVACTFEKSANLPEVPPLVGSVRKIKRPYGRYSTASDFRIALHGKCTQPCWTRLATCASGAACIVFWMSTNSTANATTNCATQAIPSQNFWAPRQISSGAGTFPMDLLLSVCDPGCMYPTTAFIQKHN